MPLSGAVIRAALAAVGAIGKQISSYDDLAEGAADALRQAPAGLTEEGAAAFLATVAVESAWFRTTTEYGKALRYDPFRGRTFVQLTWEANYRTFGKWCHQRELVKDPEVFVRTPTSLSSAEWAWLGPIFYFETHSLWQWANVGNFLAVSQAVNGGRGRVGTTFVPNGWRERALLYGVFLRAGEDLLPGPATPMARPAPRSIGDDMIIQQWDVRGVGELRRIIPIAPAGALIERAWVSVIACGARGASVQVFAQNDAEGRGDRTLIAEFRDGRSSRQWWELPAGTTQINAQFNAPDGAVICIEAKPR